ncbi:MAG: hypothetical protein IKY41_01360 [Clostridia bacterium]|nr:hypothetical protein [Clostridia bacterium]
MNTTNLTKSNLQIKYKNSRVNLLLMIALTAVNIILLFAESNYMLLFSATIPYVAVLDALWFADQSLIIFNIIIACVSVGLYVLCWILSKKHYVWMIVATVLFSLDTIYMVYFYFTANSIADGILDIAIHAYVLYFLISGIVYGYKLTKVKDDVIEGTATVEEIALELDSEGRDNIND